MTTLTRRRGTALLAALVGTALALTACSAGTTEAADSESGAPGKDGAFPVTIDTAYGEITVSEKPERIVVVPTASYLDLLDTLGEKPYAWNAGSGDAAELLAWAPWMEGIVDGEPDSSLYTADYAPSPEAIAALEPDLILTDIWNTDESVYEQLSQIAPTYVGIETDMQTSWQDHLAAIAQLTGHDPAIVDEIEDDLADAYAAAAERLPGLREATFQVPVFADEVFWITPYANDVITQLGIVPGDDQSAVVDGEWVQFSQENIDRLNADVIFFATRPYGEEAREELYAGLKSDPRLAGLPASQNGTVVYLTDSEWSAINGGTPASYRWWLEQDFIAQLESSALNQSG